MQPMELALHLQEITQELKLASLIKSLETLWLHDKPLGETGGKKINAEILASYQGFVLCQSDEIKNSILSSLGVNLIFHSDKISQMVGVFHSQHTVAPIAIIADSTNARLFESFLSSLKSLKAYSETFSRFLVSERYPAGMKDTEGIIDFEISLHETGLQPESFSSVLKSIEDLYDIIIELLGIVDAEKLVIVFVESGSLIKFSLKGSAEAMKELGKFILDVWDKWVLRQFVRTERGYEATGKAIDLISRIRNDENIKEGEADVLIERIWQNCFTVLENGAMTSEGLKSTEKWDNRKFLTKQVEVKQLEQIEVKKLQAPEPKLSEEDASDKKETNGQSSEPNATKS